MAFGDAVFGGALAGIVLVARSNDVVFIKGVSNALIASINLRSKMGKNSGHSSYLASARN